MNLVLWLWVRDRILWVANFWFSFYEICVQNQWWHKLLRPSWGLRHWRSEFNYHYDEILTCFSILILLTLCGKPMRQKALFCFFDSAWIFGGWEVVEWGRKSYVGQAEIVFFSSWSFSHLNQILCKCKTPLLFFVIIFYYTSFNQQSSATVLQNRCS